jgi:putative membrane protein
MSKLASIVVRILAIVFFLLILLLGISFSSLNSDPVTVNYYLGSITLPLSVVIITSLAAGVVAAFLIGLISILSSRIRVANLKRHVRQRELELTALRKAGARTAN